MIGDPLAITAWGRWGAPGLPEFWALGSDRREEPAVESLAVLARHCLDQALLAPGPGVGLVLGVGSAIRAPSEQHARAVFAGDTTALSPRAFLFTTANAVAARVSILLGLTGESLTLPDGAAPFWVAADLLSARRATAVLVGGATERTGRVGETGGAALLCLEPFDEARKESRPGRALLRLDSEPGSAGWSSGCEAEVAEALVHMVETGSSGMVDCGRRGRILVDRADRRTEEPAP